MAASFRYSLSLSNPGRRAAEFRRLVKPEAGVPSQTETPPSSSVSDAPRDRVAQERVEGVGFPRAAERQGRRVRGIGGAARARRGIVAVAEGHVGDAALAHVARVGERAGPAV